MRFKICDMEQPNTNGAAARLLVSRVRELVEAGARAHGAAEGQAALASALVELEVLEDRMADAQAVSDG
ncbi:MAG: hypothetical protein JO186_10060 [Actinobacteria bacterium]|nr:hypothetical protein [Actinomycetota bacterium]